MNRHYLKRTTLAALAAGLPLLASAADYTYVEGGYLYRDAYDQNGSGVRVEGSANVLPNLAAFANFSTNNDLNQFGVGALFHTPLRQGLDLTAGASLEHLDTGDDSDTGVGLRAGLRWAAAPKLELDPEIRYVSAHEDATSFRFNALYSLAPRLSLQGAAQVGDDERFEAGLRYDFGGHI